MLPISLGEQVHSMTQLLAYTACRVQAVLTVL
jgi:hypothetical protein